MLRRVPDAGRILAHVAVVLMLVAVFALSARAQSSLGLGNPEPGSQPSGFVMQYLPWLQPALNFINAKQQEFYRALSAALRSMRNDPLQLWWLVGISFLYGVFHAAGPGHGKAVISSYMLANETELRRGVLISFLSAFLQGATAILVTGAGFLLLRGTTVTMTDASKWLEVASFGLIALFGLYLLAQKLRGLTGFRARLAAVGSPPASAPVPHTHHHEHHAHHDHHHGHDHGAVEVCEVCGHAHVPSPELVSGERFSLFDAWGAITAVGLRPCSGAIFVLTFSFLNGLFLGGILSVLAMSIGTAITVSILATLAVSAKDLALRYAGQGAPAMVLGQAIEIAGAVIVTLFGVLFLLASLQLG